MRAHLQTRSASELLRQANDAIRDALPDAANGRFLCECGDDACAGIVRLRPDAYDELRRRGEGVLRHGHAIRGA